LQLPIGVESQFKGLVDLVEMKAIIWKEESLGAKFDVLEIPDDLKEKAAEYRHNLVEAAVELDDDGMSAYLDGQEPDVPTLKRLTRLGVQKGSWYPMLLGSAFKNKGVQPLLDAVVDYLPSPTDRPAIKGVDMDDPEKEIIRKSDDNEPLSILAFKIMD